LLLLLVPLLAWLRGQRGAAAALVFSSTASLRALGKRSTSSAGRIMHGLLYLALAIFIFALARPQLGKSLTEVEASGIDIMVVLDVSGSMYAEMPQIIALLGRLSRYIRRPFWAFSNCIAPAVIKNGQLVASTTGGSSMACVLQHLAQTRPATAIVITDGYIERLCPSLVENAAGVRLHALVTRDGSPAELRRAGIPYTQLEKVPA
jgi:hypothetical protein